MDVNTLVESAGLKPEDIATNWQAEGQLTDAQYQSFAKMGISRNMVDTYLHGQSAIFQNGQYAQEQIQRQAHDMVGGVEEWQNLTNWYSQNNNESTVNSMNDRLGDPNQWQDAVKSMLWDYKMQAQQGFTQPLLQGDRMPNTSSGFESVNELMQAMSKVRAQGRTDEAFKRRLANTAPHILQGIDR
tara:strand:- start:132 stop:689 length:558 start_codon:yes stop_codon:yes gene_type:complete